MIGQQTTEDDAEVAESMNTARRSRLKALSNRFSSRRNISSKRGAAAPAPAWEAGGGGDGVEAAEPTTTQQPVDVGAPESR